MADDLLLDWQGNPRVPGQFYSPDGHPLGIGIAGQSATDQAAQAQATEELDTVDPTQAAYYTAHGMDAQTAVERAHDAQNNGGEAPSIFQGFMDALKQAGAAATVTAVALVGVVVLVGGYVVFRKAAP